MTSSAAWAATHRAPSEGMDAWSDPDPEAAPSSELEGRVEVQVITTAGEWAQVRGANGWEGWVDGRLLEQIDTSGAAGDQRAYILLAVAVVVLIVLAVMGVTG
ncbi:MAG: SH3 domain-containing protein [Acidimicrobiia bacterium]|nr:SH3 domain-containing protein [Acidimicrobiia bacterium]